MTKWRFIKPLDQVEIEAIGRRMDVLSAKEYLKEPGIKMNVNVGMNGYCIVIVNNIKEWLNEME
jgi:hypothetical protein